MWPNPLHGLISLLIFCYQTWCLTHETSIDIPKEWIPRGSAVDYQSNSWELVPVTAVQINPASNRSFMYPDRRHVGYVFSFVKELGASFVCNLCSMGLWNLHCTPLQWYRATPCTTSPVDMVEKVKVNYIRSFIVYSC